MLRLPYFPTDLLLTDEAKPFYVRLLDVHLRRILQEAYAMREVAIDQERHSYRCDDPYQSIAQKILSMQRKLPVEIAREIGLTDELVKRIVRERARRFLAWKVRQCLMLHKRYGTREELVRIRRAALRHGINTSEIDFPQE